MQTITLEALRKVLALINKEVGHADNYNEAGAYTLGQAYGKVRLEQYTGQSGSIRAITQYGSKRECFEELQAFLSGMRAANEKASML